MQIFRNLFTSFLDSVGLAWWIEIGTKQPPCTYYFGPFASQSEAKEAVDGYLQDLHNEGAVDIQVQIRQMPTPKTLTIDEQGAVNSTQNFSPLVALFFLVPLVFWGLDYIF
jgi:hypothetical protein